MHNNSEVTLSIIILTCDELSETARCLDSLYKFIDHRCEIIVVDNGSKDGTAATIRKSFAGVRVFELPKNIGVGPGRNFGVKQALGKYVMTLDNDTVFFGPEPVSHIQNFFCRYPSAGVVGFKLLNEDGSIQRNFRRFPTSFYPFIARVSVLRNFSTFRANYERHMMTDIADASLENPMEVDYVIGANQIFVKKTFDQLGRYDEQIFYGPEDCELCLRFKRAKYKNYYFPAVSIAHLYKRRSRHSLTLFWAHLKGFGYIFWKYKRLFSLYP